MRKAAFNSVLAGFRSEDPEEHKRAETLALTMSAQKIADARTLYSLAWYIANEEIAAKNQFKIRNIDLAVRMARDASELAPTDSTPLTILAYAYNQQKIHEKAVATQK